jgi:hypothetical protein
MRNGGVSQDLHRKPLKQLQVAANLLSEQRVTVHVALTTHNPTEVLAFE